MCVISTRTPEHPWRGHLVASSENRSLSLPRNRWAPGTVRGISGSLRGFRCAWTGRRWRYAPWVCTSDTGACSWRSFWRCWELFRRKRTPPFGLETRSWKFGRTGWSGRAYRRGSAPTLCSCPPITFWNLLWTPKSFTHQSGSYRTISLRGSLV